MEAMAPLVQALGAPLVVLLIWFKMSHDHKKNGNGNGKTMEPVLREILLEMRNINLAMATQTRAMENVIERLIMHDTASAVAIDNISEVRGGVSKLVSDMEMRQRGIYRP